MKYVIIYKMFVMHAMYCYDRCNKCSFKENEVKLKPSAIIINTLYLLGTVFHMNNHAVHDNIKNAKL